MKLHQGILYGYNRRKDRSVSVTFHLQETSSEDLKEIDETCDQFGTLYFKESGHLTQEEKEAIDKADIPNEGKSQSQRIRSVMYLIWQQKYEYDKTVSFEYFYKSKTEEIINHFKSQLDES